MYGLITLPVDLLIRFTDFQWGEAAAFVRTDDPNLFPESEFPGRLAESASSTTSPELEIFTTGIAYKDHGAYGFKIHSFGIHVCLLK